MKRPLACYLLCLVHFLLGANALFGGGALIINLSGSPKAVREQWAVIAPVLPHALELLRPTNHSLRHARAGEHVRKLDAAV